MKNFALKVFLVAMVISTAGLALCKAQTAPFSENNLVFLCFGQSNMQGDAQPEIRDKTGVSYRFQKMYAANSDGTNMGKWVSATLPLCRRNTGLTPVDYFGRYLIDSLDTKLLVMR